MTDLCKDMNGLAAVVKKTLEEAGVKTRLVDNCSMWHKVYKDTVFNETLFYKNRDTFAVKVLKGLTVSASCYSSPAVSISLDTATMYPKSVEELRKTLETLVHDYELYHNVYMTLKEDIDRENKALEKLKGTTCFKDFNKYVNATERRLNAQIDGLTKIQEL